MSRSGATAQVKGQAMQWSSRAAAQSLSGHSVTYAGIWDMTCKLRPQQDRNRLVTLLSIAIPLGVLALTVIVTTLFCWRFGSALGRQWEAMRVARYKRK